ncbi:MAG: SiaC family regulatory phosphoprotein [Bacteroidales bacterium]
MSENQKILSPTRSTPEVVFESKGIIKITGRLIPDNPTDFFNLLDKAIDEYFCNAPDVTCLEIYLEYINSEGTMSLIETINKIIHIHLRDNKKKLIINWYYKDDDEDLLEKGTFFSSVLDTYISLIKII